MLSQPAGWGDGRRAWRCPKWLTEGGLRQSLPLWVETGQGVRPAQGASGPVHTWQVGPPAGSQAVQAGPSQLQPESQPAPCRGSHAEATWWGGSQCSDTGPGCGPGKGSGGAVRRVPARTPENRAQPPREGPAGVSGLLPPCEGKQGAWGTEAWNPVTWSSSGQIVLCETRDKEAPRWPGRSPRSGGEQHVPRGPAGVLVPGSGPVALHG